MSRSEKTKSSVFEKMGLSTKRKHSSKQNGTGTRPVSSNETEHNDLDQEIEMRIRNLKSDEVRKEYRRMITEDMNVPTDKLEPLLQKSLEEMRMLLILNERKGN